MKICTYNVQGLNSSNKFKAFWKWVLCCEMDIACVQDHKMHSHAGHIQHCNGYTILYGGKQGFYSSTMMLVRNKYKPSLLFNHPSGRALGVHISSEFGLLCISCIYGPNAVVPEESYGRIFLIKLT